MATVQQPAVGPSSDDDPFARGAFFLKPPAAPAAATGPPPTSSVGPSCAVSSPGPSHIYSHSNDRFDALGDLYRRTEEMMWKMDEVTRKTNKIQRMMDDMTASLKETAVSSGCVVARGEGQRRPGQKSPSTNTQV
ncbi:hypothetical protein FA95DRAFT_1566658, partial [Auriscalpium vulgare]